MNSLQISQLIPTLLAVSLIEPVISKSLFTASSSLLVCLPFSAKNSICSVAWPITALTLEGSIGDEERNLRLRMVESIATLFLYSCTTTSCPWQWGHSGIYWLILYGRDTFSSLNNYFSCFKALKEKLSERLLKIIYNDIHGRSSLIDCLSLTQS